MHANYPTKQALYAVVIVLSILVSVSADAGAVRAGFLYTLSSFTGLVPYNHARLAVDKEREEVYVLYQNNIRVFNTSGMEIYQFGDDLDLGHVVDLVVDREGDILLLVYKDSRPVILRCNFRGEVQSTIELSNLPERFAGDFSPNRMVYAGEDLYLASSGGMKIVVVDRKGNYRRGYDLFAVLDLEEKDRGNAEIGGLSVDGEGNILLTIPVLFTAYVISPDGKVKSFGKPGGAPGRFNIVSGIARDSRGHFLIVDKLKCAVMVYDRNFNFLSQFSSRGYKPGNLIYPDDIAVEGDRVYVTQMGKRGVSVWKLTYN